jgi:hypothetical protein
MNKIQFRLSIKISLAAPKTVIENFQFHSATFSAFPLDIKIRMFIHETANLQLNWETTSCYSLSETHKKKLCASGCESHHACFPFVSRSFSLIMIPFQCQAWHFRAFCSVRDKIPINFINFFSRRKKYSNLRLVFQCLGYHI